MKAPRIYFRDSGLLHLLSGIRTRADLLEHPRSGASWEGFALEECIRLSGASSEECHFWRTHTGAELDLLVARGRERTGFEFKRSASPGLTPSMRIALSDLRLSRLFVVHPGRESYSLGSRVEAVPLGRLAEAL